MRPYDKAPEKPGAFFGDPEGNRTPVTAVKGPCLNLLTTGPKISAFAGPMNNIRRPLQADLTGWTPVKSYGSGSGT